LSFPNIEDINDRALLHKFVLDQWANETPNTQYLYEIDRTANNKLIYLERPAQLNKGCDFKIYVEDLIINKTNPYDKPPNFKYLLDDLKEKKSKHPSDWGVIFNALESIYKCKSLNDAMNIVRQLNIQTGLDLRTVFILLRWFFIEQDITYWLSTGREMLWNEILNI
jgi:hypothetical protein